MAHYNFAPGKLLGRKYEVLAARGQVREGEIYTLSECATGIERTAKFFHRHLSSANRIADLHARTLHKLRHCPIILSYRTQETIHIAGSPVTFLVADFVPGDLLGDFIGRQPGLRLDWFEALHLIHALAHGVNLMHGAGESCGALRYDNIVVRRHGLGFQIKLLELATRRASPEAVRYDVRELLGLFHTLTAGAGGARALPAAVRELVGTPRRYEEKALHYRDASALLSAINSLPWAAQGPSKSTRSTALQH